MTPKIIIPMNIRNEIQFLVDNCALEISGLGNVVYDKDANAYRVVSIILLDQEVGAAHTDIDDAAVAQAVYDLRDSEGELAFWWHSHVNMDTFWSGTDKSTMIEIGKNGLCVAVVFNKKEEMRGALVMSPDGFPSYLVDDVDIEIEYTYDFDTEAKLAEMKAKVREKKYVSYQSQGAWSHGGHTPANIPSNVGHVGKVLNEKEMNILGYQTTNRKNALDEWSRLGKDQRKRWTDFEDYYEEMCWNEYNPVEQITAMMD